MKCVMCGRRLFNPALVAGDLAFGPKCAKKLKRNPNRFKKVHVGSASQTLPLFGEMSAEQE